MAGLSRAAPAVIVNIKETPLWQTGKDESMSSLAVSVFVKTESLFCLRQLEYSCFFHETFHEGLTN